MYRSSRRRAVAVSISYWRTMFLRDISKTFISTRGFVVDRRLYVLTVPVRVVRPKDAGIGSRMSGEIARAMMGAPEE
jgi:hypothetical protein